MIIKQILYNPRKAMFIQIYNIYRAKSHHCLLNISSHFIMKSYVITEEKIDRYSRETSLGRTTSTPYRTCQPTRTITDAITELKTA